MHFKSMGVSSKGVSMKKKKKKQANDGVYLVAQTHNQQHSKTVALVIHHQMDHCQAEVLHQTAKTAHLLLESKETKLSLKEKKNRTREASGYSV